MQPQQFLAKLKVMIFRSTITIHKEGRWKVIRGETITTIVPQHRELARGTLLSVLDLAKVYEKDFLTNTRKSAPHRFAVVSCRLRPCYTYISFRSPIARIMMLPFLTSKEARYSPMRKRKLPNSKSVRRSANLSGSGVAV